MKLKNILIAAQGLLTGIAMAVAPGIPNVSLTS